MSATASLVQGFSKSMSFTMNSSPSASLAERAERMASLISFLLTFWS